MMKVTFPSSCPVLFMFSRIGKNSYYIVVAMVCRDLKPLGKFSRRSDNDAQFVRIASNVYKR